VNQAVLNEEKTMFIEIMKHVPIWVFALFFALLGLGYFQSRERTLSRARVAILPVAMTGFSFYGVVSAFGVTPLGMVSWLLGVAVAATLGLALGAPKKVAFLPATASFHVPGSWVPLVLMMMIFFAKFAVNVAMAVAGDVAGTAVFADAVSLCYGLFSGVFLARALVIWRSQKSPGSRMSQEGLAA
jgi:hypothetical protein